MNGPAAAKPCAVKCSLLSDSNVHSRLVARFRATCRSGDRSSRRSASVSRTPTRLEVPSTQFRRQSREASQRCHAFGRFERRRRRFRLSTPSVHDKYRRDDEDQLPPPLQQEKVAQGALQCSLQRAPRDHERSPLQGYVLRTAIPGCDM